MSVFINIACDFIVPGYEGSEKEANKKAHEDYCALVCFWKTSPVVLNELREEVRARLVELSA